MGRFVPRPFMDLLGRQHVTEVVLGDCVQMPMAVLFSDFRGFTTVAEGKTAPQLFALLNQFYTQIAPLVRWHGGFVDKYVGDGMMALFPGGAQDALAAAQAMVQAVQTISTEHGMAMGMGIHCGSTMLGTLGEPQRFDTTVISDVVNSASRLEGASKQLGADIVVSQAVLDAVSTDTPLQIRRLGKLRLKGKNEVLEVAEVLTALENSAHRQAKWQQRAVFEQAVLDCAEGRYAQARVSLGQLCKQCPTDLAAQLYLEAAIQADEGQPAQVFDRGALILKEK
jgi:class 3 adenylate cyclase